MLKKIGLTAAAVVAGALLSGGAAFADTHGEHGGSAGQVGLVNLNNVDALHNVNGTLGFCGNDVNVLGVQVPIRHSLDGIGVPVLSPGDHTAAGNSPENCASGTVVDGGSIQHN
ncbi:hypothetical protein GCM10022222_32660 [Amycolatopsis ultiminotia]|uniref:Small secreted domain n=1 Tax=Amycolatopsis ultiminotia TaxID=543629 RepID=A0ABP6W4U5_9PSEU